MYSNQYIIIIALIQYNDKTNELKTIYMDLIFVSFGPCMQFSWLVAISHNICKTYHRLCQCSGGSQKAKSEILD